VVTDKRHREQPGQRHRNVVRRNPHDRAQRHPLQPRVVRTAAASPATTTTGRPSSTT
jgi:hypothetical protein